MAVASPYVKFRMPTADNLIPIRIEVDVDDESFRDTICWHAEEPDNEVHSFVKKLVLEEKLPSSFLQPIVQSIQSQLSDFRSFQNQFLSTDERLIPIKIDSRINQYHIRDQFLWDLGNLESDPEKFSLVFCKDMGIDDPRVSNGLAFQIREQLLDAAKFNLSGTLRESRFSKKPRRQGIETIVRRGASALTLMKRPNNKVSVYRRNVELEAFEAVVEKLTDQEASTQDALEERVSRESRRRKRQEEAEDYERMLR